MKFIKGLSLSENFFFDVAKPILDKYFGGLTYSAGLIGYGSDVLGYDDEVSTDHMWGPRFYLFLGNDDISRKPEIMDAFGRLFPYEYMGYSVHFTDPGISGVRGPERISKGPVSPLVFIHTPDDYLEEYLGAHDLKCLSALHWLSFSEHRLLSLTSGKIFVDGLHMKDDLALLEYYPEDVRLYLMASNWSLIAEEQAYVRRCSDVRDELGSRLVCGRIAERLMRLAFLYCRKYAPYSKWFGTAFSRLNVDESIKSAILSAVSAQGVDEREHHIVSAQKMMADLHNQSGVTEYVDIQVERYYDRAISVIFPDKITDTIIKTLSGTEFECYPLIGTFSGVANFTNLFDDPRRQSGIKALYSTP